MPALNFKKQFMAAVLNGTKCQTIRATRKHPIRPGDFLHLYTGMRTKQCLRLRVVKCTAVTPIRITILQRTRQASINLGGSIQSPESCEELARRDGFNDLGDFLSFFEETHGPVFSGHLIEWRA